MAEHEMGPIEVLVAEHRVIGAVLGCMERMASRIEEGGTADLESARRAVEFMNGYADRLHHEKEEAILFPTLGRLGILSSNRPFVMMCHEHEMGRAHLRRMGKFLDSWSAGGAAGRQAALSFAADARSYASLFREHIRREDDELFPAVHRALHRDDLSVLADAFDSADRESLRPDARERLTELARTLLDRWPAPEEPDAEKPDPPLSRAARA
ncbi:MAG: hypothetical protein HMLKMBBP_02944 [Planctomycetes bacterium]|nr:hypothetical protein [Planctomycetota bacterium]